MLFDVALDSSLTLVRTRVTIIMSQSHAWQLRRKLGNFRTINGTRDVQAAMTHINADTHIVFRLSLNRLPLGQLTAPPRTPDSIQWTQLLASRRESLQ
jgi:hypothetical protein